MKIIVWEITVYFFDTQKKIFHLSSFLDAMPRSSDTKMSFQREATSYQVKDYVADDRKKKERKALHWGRSSSAKKEPFGSLRTLYNVR